MNKSYLSLAIVTSLVAFAAPAKAQVTLQGGTFNMGGAWGVLQIS